MVFDQLDSAEDKRIQSDATARAERDAEREIEYANKTAQWKASRDAAQAIADKAKSELDATRKRRLTNAGHPSGEWEYFMTHEKVPGTGYPAYGPTEWRDRSIPEADEALSMSDLNRGAYETDSDGVPALEIFSPTLFSGGDYANSGSIEVANFNVIKSDFCDGKLPGVWETYGGYGSFGIAIDARLLDHTGTDGGDDETDPRHARGAPSCLNCALLERLRSLDSYPVLDDDELSSVESEAEDEAWNSWAKSDFRRELVKRFGPDADADLLDTDVEWFSPIVDWIEALDDDDLADMFRLACDASNTYWENEQGNSAYIRLDDVVGAVSIFPLDPRILWVRPHSIGNHLRMDYRDFSLPKSFGYQR